MEIGDVILRRYELREALGGDELGQVFRAMDEQELREVVITVFDPARCPTDAVSRYAARVASAAQAKHPAIALPRVEIGGEGAPSVAVEEVRVAEDLDALRAQGALPWRRAAEIVATCAEALAALTTATGAAHRALRPASIRVGEYGKIHVVDFGVVELGARPVPPRGDVHVEYRAPEQLEGAPGDARSDVFTLGALLFELTTGVHPFSGPSAFKATHKVLLQATPKPSDVAPASPLPAAVEGLLLRALARNPADRFADPDELAKALAHERRSAGDLAPTPAASVPDSDEVRSAGDHTPVASEWRTLYGEAGAIPLDDLLAAVSEEPRDTVAPPLLEPEERTEQLPPTVDPPAAPVATAVERTEVSPPTPGRSPPPNRTAVERTEVLPPAAGRPPAPNGTAAERTGVLPPAAGRPPAAARPAAERAAPRPPRVPEETTAPVAATADDDGPTRFFAGSMVQPPTHASPVPGPAPAASPELPAVAQTSDEAMTQPARADAPGSLRHIVWINVVFLALAAVGLAWLVAN